MGEALQQSLALRALTHTRGADENNSRGPLEVHSIQKQETPMGEQAREGCARKGDAQQKSQAERGVTMRSRLSIGWRAKNTMGEATGVLWWPNTDWAFSVNNKLQARKEKAKEQNSTLSPPGHWR